MGPSGLGAYHGKASFDVFSHQRSTLITSQGLEWINESRYPPYTAEKLKLLKPLLSGEGVVGVASNWMFPWKGANKKEKGEDD